MWIVFFYLVEQQQTRMEVDCAGVLVDGLVIVWEVKGCVAYSVGRVMLP
jgi:hypothetical protein